MKILTKWLVSLCLSVVAASPAVIAQEGPGGGLESPPAPPPPVPSETATAPGAAGTAAPAVQPAAQVAGEVAPGPLQEQRKRLLDRIEESRRLGVGVGPYRTAFSQMEDMVKSGAPQETVQKRVDSLNGSLLEQLRRMRDIKARPPVATTAVSSPSASLAPGATASSIGSGAMIEQLRRRFGNQIPTGQDREQLIEHLKQKYGDQIPGALANPAVRERLMQSEVGQRILDKLQK